MMKMEEPEQAKRCEGVWAEQSEKIGLQSDTKLRAIFERLAAGIALIDREGCLIEGNLALRRMLGVCWEELQNRPFGELIHPDDARGDAGLYPQLISGARDYYQVERRYIRKGGGFFWGLTNVSLLRNGTGEPEFTIFMIEDITERKQLENQLFQSQKMETVGRLAGGIAHDFNNLLTVLSGYTDLSLQGIRENDPLRTNLEEIKKAVEKASALTRQLLVFSRRQAMDLKAIDLNTVVKDLDRMLRRIIGEDIELKVQLATDLGEVRSDPGQIEQVILNLAVNARDAMPKGGTLLIETANIELDEDYARFHISVDPGQYVMLSVADTGCGMTAEVKEHIFEPFFTTKEKDKGTGLGLSTVYGIVKQSGGNIWTYSEPGRGTIFKIYLPCMGKPIDPLPSREKQGLLPGGKETILIVEDEPSVRRLAAQVLARQGYSVLEAASGNEALGLARDRKAKRIDLLLTDVVMPQMGGQELVSQLKNLHPETKVLFMSGYSDTALTGQALINPGKPLLEKPFSPVTLAKKVRETLDQ
jgi:two-component system, cell cycle sensor histidine kinase and response regulator CckA